MRALLDQYRRTSHADKQKDRLVQFDQAWEAFGTAANEVLALSTQSKTAEATELLSSRYRQILDFVDGGLTELARTSEDLAAAGQKKSGPRPSYRPATWCWVSPLRCSWWASRSPS